MTKTSKAAFAKKAGFSSMSVIRYLNGQRIPRPAEMERIFVATEGLVTPNDFYGLVKTPALKKLPPRPDRARRPPVVARLIAPSRGVVAASCDDNWPPPAPQE